MKRFIFWTGIISILSGFGLQFAAFGKQLMPLEPQGMLVHLFGLMAMFLGIMLIFCTRDLRTRGGLVIWEAGLRIGGFVLMGGYGIWGGGGLKMALGGVFDLTVGIVYLVWLPRHLGVSIITLLLDKK